MKVKSSVLFGLIVLICLISGFSLLKRMTREIDEWRPSDLYSSSNISRRSTFSVVSSAPASYSESVVTVSSGASSMFRHRAVSSYAPAYAASSSLANIQYPIGGTPSNSVASPVYTTSSAEIRSFGGGNGGTVSMSGGSIKASSSPVASASSLSISMPSNSIYAYNTNGNGVASRDVMSSVSGDIAMASTQSYTGIGNTTGPRGMSGRKNSTSGNSILTWLAQYGQQYGTKTGDDENGYTYSYDYYQLKNAYDAYCLYMQDHWDEMWGTSLPLFDEWLLWFQGNEGSHSYRGDMYNWVPVGDYYPLLILAMLYVGYMVIRRRKQQVLEN